MLTETEEGVTLDVNHPGTFNTVCVELDMASLAVNTLIQVTSKLLDLTREILWIFCYLEIPTAVLRCNMQSNIIILYLILNKILYTFVSIRNSNSKLNSYFSQPMLMTMREHRLSVLTQSPRHHLKTWYKVRGRLQCWQAMMRLLCAP